MLTSSAKYIGTSRKYSLDKRMLLCNLHVGIFSNVLFQCGVCHHNLFSCKIGGFYRGNRQCDILMTFITNSRQQAFKNGQINKTIESTNQRKAK